MTERFFLIERVREPHALEPLSELGKLYQRQGRAAEAETVLLQALALQERALGGEDESLGSRLQALVNFYRQERRYAEAENHHRRHLAPLIPAGHGIAAVATFVLAVVSAISAR